MSSQKCETLWNKMSTMCRESQVGFEDILGKLSDAYLDNQFDDLTSVGAYLWVKAEQAYKAENYDELKKHYDSMSVLIDDMKSLLN